MVSVLRPRIWLLAASAALILLEGPARAQGAMTPDQVADLLAERFGVEVLKVAEGEDAERPVYVVTVMNPAGNYNGAFQVTRLVVDRQTGELVSQFRHESAGYALPGGTGGEAGTGADGRAIRRMTNQGSPGGSGQ